jgi:hypothetical protein
VVLIITRFYKLNTNDPVLLGHDVASMAHWISALQGKVMSSSSGVETDILRMSMIEGSTLS